MHRERRSPLHLPAMACRWASYIAEPSLAKIDEELVSLPAKEQVARGQELMSLLQSSDMLSNPKKLCDARLPELDWNIIVKQTFLEVVMPRESMKRSMSDSALPRFDKTETHWKSFASDKNQDMSDASTNVSIEEVEDSDTNFARSPSREDLCWSSDGEVEAEFLPQMEVQSSSATQLQINTDLPTDMPYQPYVDPWWMPVSYGSPVPAMCSASPGSFEPSPMTFDSSSFMPMQWASHSMGAVECQSMDIVSDQQEWRTTVMIRNMPNNYTREMLLELVDSMGFAGTYDFAYLPVDFQSQAGLGYAFLNFMTVADARACFERFEGFSNWTVPSEKVCTVTWSSPTQGLEAHIERYRNSPVMHPSLPDEWKPVLIHHGMRVAFPPPSKPIKTPKVRQHPSAKNA